MRRQPNRPGGHCIGSWLVIIIDVTQGRIRAQMLAAVDQKLARRSRRIGRALPIHNAEIAEMFNRLADPLEIENANPFRVRAYRNAARTLNSLPRSVTSMLKKDEDLSRLPGIGKDLVPVFCPLLLPAGGDPR